MKEPVDHILRPLLPWRTGGAVTECGLNGASVKALTRADYAARLKGLGQQRAALLTCMTCSRTFEDYPDWQTEPRLAIGREVRWESVHYSRGQVFNYGESKGSQLRDDLFAIEALIAAHPEEFRKLVDDIAARREWQERQKARKPEQPPARGRNRI